TDLFAFLGLDFVLRHSRHALLLLHDYGYSSVWRFIVMAGQRATGLFGLTRLTEIGDNRWGIQYCFTQSRTTHLRLVLNHYKRSQCAQSKRHLLLSIFVP
ncbi:MAG: hypothetical protein RLZZ337_1941, partial [Bacteroidota bacterium]